jgi:hypothetical protein
MNIRPLVIHWLHNNQWITNGFNQRLTNGNQFSNQWVTNGNQSLVVLHLVIIGCITNDNQWAYIRACTCTPLVIHWLCVRNQWITNGRISQPMHYCHYTLHTHYHTHYTRYTLYIYVIKVVFIYATHHTTCHCSAQNFF